MGQKYPSSASQARDGKSFSRRHQTSEAHQAEVDLRDARERAKAERIAKSLAEKRSPEEQLKRLNERGERAVKERAKLAKKIEAAKSAGVKSAAPAPKAETPVAQRQRPMGPVAKAVSASKASVAQSQATPVAKVALAAKEVSAIPIEAVPVESAPEKKPVVMGSNGRPLTFLSALAKAKKD
ncbi:MAG: hypothetical protein Q7S28_02640 [bacterium]|nr:hypothetical protein [bacterium]